MFIDNNILSEWLLDARLLTKEELLSVRARATEPGSLCRVLVEQGILKEDELRRATAHCLAIEHRSFSAADAPSLDESLLVPEAFARTHGLAVVSARNRVARIALLSLDELPAAQALPTLRGWHVEPILTDGESLRALLRAYQTLLAKRAASELHSSGATASPLTPDAFRATLAPLLVHAHASSADALKLTVRGGDSLVEHRVNGQWYDAHTLPVARGNALMQAVHALALPKNILSGSVSVPHHSGLFHIHALQGVRSPYAETVLVEINKASDHEAEPAVFLEELGVPEQLASLLRAYGAGRGGLVIVSGLPDALRKTLQGITHAFPAGRTLTALMPHSQMEVLPRGSTIALPTPPAEESAASHLRALQQALRTNPEILFVSPAQGIDRSTLTLLAQAAARGIFVVVLSGEVDLLPLSSVLSTLQKDLPINALPVTVKSIPTLCPGCRKLRKLSSRELDSLTQTGIHPSDILDILRERGIETPASFDQLELYRQQDCPHQLQSEFVYDYMPTEEAAIVGAEEAVRNARRELVRELIIRAAQGRVSIEDVLTHIEQLFV